METMSATAFAEQKKATEDNDTLCDAFVAFVSEVTDWDDESVEVSELQSAWHDHELNFLGEWDDFVDFVRDYAEDHYVIDGDIVDYINWEDMANDWEMGYNIVSADGGTVYVWTA